MTADGLHDGASLRILNAGFEECEQIIERGLGTFIEVGSALVRIREGRLYRQEYASFEVYCQRRWGFSDRRARQLMAAAEIGTVVPVTTESQARELTGLSPDEAQGVYEQAAETRPEPTAADLRAARERLHPKTPPPALPPVAITHTTTEKTVEEFIADRDTGEVLSVEDWQAQTADLDAQLDARLDSTDDRFLLSLARGIASCNALLALSPQRVVDTYAPDSDDAAALDGLLDRIDNWAGAVRAGLRPSLRRIK